MDLPAGICRTGLERREDGGAPDHQHGGDGAFQQSQIPHSVRCRGKEVGSFCRVGFGGQWRIHAAGAPEMTVDEYLAKVPEPARGTLNKIRTVIRSAVPPDATECISYGMPAFRYKGALLGYAAFPNHCGLYPMNP